MDNTAEPLEVQAEDLQGQYYSWRDLSETTLGLLAEGIISPHVIDPIYFAPPYDKGAKRLCAEGATREDLGQVLSPDIINTLHNKVANMNGAGAMYDWVKMLRQAYESYRLGEIIERTAYALKKNLPVDMNRPYQMMSDFMTKDITGIKAAAEIEYRGYHPFMKSGDEAIDNLIGGWPTDGPIIVYGDTGAGKSFFGIKSLIEFLLEHQDKTGAAYSFEMNEEHYLSRAARMYPKLEKVKSRLYVSGSLDKPADLVPDVMTHNFDFVLVDDMDNMFDGEASPGKYEGVFKLIKRIARLKRIPVMALSQAKMRGEKQAGKFLTKYDAAWSAANERSAALLIALQVAGRMDRGWQGDPTFPTLDDQMQYIIFWKSRDGWPKQPGPGAIIREIEKDTGGQSKNGMWSGPLYRGENHLWQPARIGGN